VTSPLLLNEGPSSELYLEGEPTALWAKRYERDPSARDACVAHHGWRCSVCEMSFAERYGEKNFIHVHHLFPLSKIGTMSSVNPIDDLRPVCPNCHAVIHRHDPPLSIEEARRRLLSN
jgi:5-methylcytosine-specific restriction protein A